MASRIAPPAQPPTLRTRASGILLHVTSLPGPYGVGDLGPDAFAWVDTLARAKQTWWQILPLGPPGAGDSPYQCYSAFAGNPLLISPDQLLTDGLLTRTDLPTNPLPPDRVDYRRASALKNALLARAWERYQGAAGGRRLRRAVDEFIRTQADWLDDFALFMALAETTGTAHWPGWPRELARRDRRALRRATDDTLTDSLGRHQFTQFLFWRQLQALRAYARTRGVKLIGDLPIFVSADSSDVWANPHLFELDRALRPRAVAGVPPDYFSKTGQRWGNPLYDWSAMKREGYAWWLRRVRATLAQVDVVRIDHFRGFEAYWRVPAHLPTAVRGRWIKAPGRELFQKFRKELGALPFIAEDLGVITPEVERLRDEFALPGMRVLQFAFGGGPDNPFLPHHYTRNAVAYTGTHDNDTTAGWFAALDKKTRAAVRRYALGVNGQAAAFDAAWSLIQLAWSSVADTAIAPLQDVLSLGTKARMNTPATATGNWRWRFRPEMLDQERLDRLAEVTTTYGRA